MNKVCLFGISASDGEFLEAGNIDVSVVVRNDYTIDCYFEENCNIYDFSINILQEKILQLFDTVIVFKCKNCSSQYIENAVNTFLQKGKIVYNYFKFDEKIDSNFRNTYANNYNSFFNFSTIKGKKSKVKPLEIPVICVWGIQPNILQEKVEVKLYNELLVRNNRVALHSTSDYAKNLYIKNVQINLFDEGKETFEDLQVQIESCLKNQMDFSEFDVFIMGIPYDLIKDYDEYFKFFMALYSVCMPDYIVCVAGSEFLQNNSIDVIDSITRKCFLAKTDMLILTNTIDDIAYYEQGNPNRPLIYEESGNKDISIELIDSIKVLQISGSEAIRVLVDDIEDKLGGEGECRVLQEKI